MAGMVTGLRLLADRTGTLLGENTPFNGIGFTKHSSSFTFGMATMAMTYGHHRMLLLFWHSLDIIWVGIFSFVYLLGPA